MAGAESIRFKDNAKLVIPIDCHECTDASIAINNAEQQVQDGVLDRGHALILLSEQIGNCTDGLQQSDEVCPSMRGRPICGHPDGGCSLRHLFQSPSQ